MVNATETQDFEAARLMIFVDIALAPRHCIFARNHRRPRQLATPPAPTFTGSPGDRWNHHNALRAVQNRIGTAFLDFLEISSSTRAAPPILNNAADFTCLAGYALPIELPTRERKHDFFAQRNKGVWSFT